MCADSLVCAGRSCKQCGTDISQKNPHAQFCSDHCRLVAWVLSQNPQEAPLTAPGTTHGRQLTLRVDPEPLLIAQPPHNPKLVAKLKPAALKVLALLEDGRPHDRQELQAVGGNRYCARIEELRTSGKVILGPRKSPKHRLYRTEPMGPGQVERYRMVYGVKL